MNGISQLKIYSLGLVAENKALDSKDIEVVCIEENPMMDGEITSNAVDYTAAGVDASGVAYKESIATTNSIIATWLPLGNSNRVTAPDVRRGETVAVYRFGDTDKFYWITLKDDLNLRKRETVIYAFSGTADETAKMDASNTYFLEVSTHKKLLHLHTSNADGEPYAYDIQINTAEGFIQIQDDDGNYLKFDSVERQIGINNRDGSVVEINKDIINFASTNAVNIKTTNYNLICTAAIVKTVTLEENASTSITVKTTSLSETATDATFKATTLDSTAKVNQTGDVKTTGNIDITGDTKAMGLVDITGNTTITGTETVNGPSMLNGGISMGPSASGAPSSATLNGNITINGNSTINGNVDGSGTFKNNGINIGATHVHSTAQGNSGPPQ